MPPNPVLEKLKTLVFEFKDTVPVVVALRNTALSDIHWKQIQEDIIGEYFDVKSPSFTLQSLIDLDAQAHQQKIQEVSTQATQETILESMFT
jgi:dynein heavy chain